MLRTTAAFCVNFGTVASGRGSKQTKITLVSPALADSFPGGIGRKHRRCRRIGHYRQVCCRPSRGQAIQQHRFLCTAAPGWCTPMRSYNAASDAATGGMGGAANNIIWFPTPTTQKLSFNADLTEPFFFSEPIIPSIRNGSEPVGIEPGRSRDHSVNRKRNMSMKLKHLPYQPLLPPRSSQPPQSHGRWHQPRHCRSLRRQAVIPGPLTKRFHRPVQPRHDAGRCDRMVSPVLPPLALPGQVTPLTSLSSIPAGRILSDSGGKRHWRHSCSAYRPDTIGSDPHGCWCF